MRIHPSGAPERGEAGLLPAVLRRAPLWWCALGAWFALLWILSSLPPTGAPKVEIPHLDKLVHFVYFAAGGFCFAMGTLVAKPSDRQPGTTRLLAVTAVVFLVLGAIDEWHQTWTEGRSGNDRGDLAADVLGGLAGAAVASAALRSGRPFRRLEPRPATDPG